MKKKKRPTTVRNDDRKVNKVQYFALKTKLHQGQKKYLSKVDHEKSDFEVFFFFSKISIKTEKKIKTWFLCLKTQKNQRLPPIIGVQN